MKVTLLGTGTSHGIPMIGCNCPICTSTDPKDKRTRSSIVIEYNDKCILVDTSPELRLQCIAYGISLVHAILFTHPHADHVAGLDDVRRFNWLHGDQMVCYGLKDTLDVIRRMFLYAFEDDPDYPSHKPDLRLVPVDGPFELFGRVITPVPLMHGPLPVLGFRVGDCAYCTDCSFISESSLRLLENLDVLVLDAVRRKPHPTHFNLEQAVDVARRIGARRTIFTHIAHELKHAETNAELPEGITLGFDGQVIELD